MTTINDINALMDEIKEQFCLSLEGKTVSTDDVWGDGDVGSLSLTLNPDIEHGYSFTGVEVENVGTYQREISFQPGFDRKAIGWYSSAEYAACW